MSVLVINCGSSSVKFKVIDTQNKEVLKAGKIERIGEEKTHENAIAEILAGVSEFDIDVVGHRVVHGGEKFHDATLIDDAVIDAIESCVPLAPLHNPANLQGIRTAKKALPSIPHVAVFDTAFHVRMPRRAKTYAIDAETAKAHGIRRYGFHGPSHEFVAGRAAAFLDRPLRELRLITCHLGNGASVCAIEYGKSVETSMGMTPLEGLAMGTRSGDVDPGVVLMLAKELGIEATDELLNRKSGLFGVSGVSNDLRDLQKQASEGHDGSRLAIAVYAHRVRKYIGAYAATMGGVDAVIMTGGVGENSVSMRQRILQRFDFLGLAVDDDLNMDAKVGSDTPVVEIGQGRVKALVVATNEELMIATQAAKVKAGEKDVSGQRTIPIAVSARHIHLNREAMDILFGKGSELTVLKEISQPGQFASEQKLNLIGPRRRIDGVRILGPLRSANQIEISRTDEFHLGVDAPIRDSGKVVGSAPVTLEGPEGTVHLNEGLICARRHIHMHSDDAEHFGVKDKDEVEVCITGGPRDLTFGDVLVRVKDSYLLEMHIDTDEANAAELNRGAVGDLVYETPASGARALIRSKRSS